mmetsp:Transcript_3729/g.7979  ORF Transcript_3729/g.7979 Transcript_3729/m.7979 type:complete len:108 (-) Transcript_3729:48-371(-)
MQELLSYRQRFHQVNKKIRETQHKQPLIPHRKISQPANDRHWDLHEENEQLRAKVKAQEREIASLREQLSKLSDKVKPVREVPEKSYPAILEGSFEHYVETRMKATR